MLLALGACAPPDAETVRTGESDGQSGESGESAENGENGEPPGAGGESGEIREPDEALAGSFGESRVELSGAERQIELAAYVADTPGLRRQGLQGWSGLPERTGMLFVYDQETTGGFWMKDTLIALSIAFADGSGRIHTILDMEPCDRDPCPTYTPEAPYQYALEVEQGLFDELGVKPGWSLDPAVDARSEGTPGAGA